jgi:hypothetical protein
MDVAIPQKYREILGMKGGEKIPLKKKENKKVARNFQELTALVSFIAVNTRSPR